MPLVNRSVSMSKNEAAVGRWGHLGRGTSPQPEREQPIPRLGIEADEHAVDARDRGNEETRFSGVPDAVRGSRP
jgi:hypothetical protein